ncbi:mobilome CxxCx(11)CxxC protein [Nocardia beijingensis]
MTQPAQSSTDQLRSEAWDRALHVYGTAYLFAQRARFYRMLLRFSAFLGIALPLIVGAVALAGVSTDLRGVVVVAGLLGVPVVVVSAWSLVADWAGGYAAATQSEAANYQLNDAYTDLAGHPPADEGEFRQRFQLIRAQDNAQRDRDLLAVSKLYSSKTVQCDSAGCYSFDTANLS